MLSGARAGLLAGVWAALILTLYDLARIDTAMLPWANGWAHVGEVLLLGLLFYALPLAALLSVTGAVAGRMEASGAAPAALHSLVSGAAVCLAMLIVATGLVADGGARARWLTAPWIAMRA